MDIIEDDINRSYKIDLLSQKINRDYNETTTIF